MDEQTPSPSGQPGTQPDTLSETAHTMKDLSADAQHVWAHVSHSPLGNLWNFDGASPLVIMKRSAKSFIDDNLVSRAAELGFYFLFALFPMLLSASSILGLAAKNASTFYVGLLDYLSIVIPHGAFQMVIDTFNQTANRASSGKITFGLAAALWSASVGFAAIQDTANIVYKVRETRPYWKSKLQAIGVTILLIIVITFTLGTLLAADFLDKRVGLFVHNHYVLSSERLVIHLVSWIVVLGLLMLLFALIYYYAPDLKNKRWHWLTPGASVGILGWLLASLGFRVYIHYFDSYSATYGSLGAVIVLLTWFYVTGLMLLAGAEINSEIQAAVTEKHLKEHGEIPAHATTDPDHPVPVATA